MAGESILAKMAVYISANTAQFNQQLALTNNKLNAFEKGIMGAAKNIGMAFGFTGLVIGLRNVVGSLAGFEHAMSEVKAITQASKSEFTDLREDALRLGAATKFTAQEVAGLQTAYGRLGFSTKEILNATGATLNLAQATGEDLAKSADVAGSTLRAFGLDASEMARVVDVMASSFNKSALGLENFSEAMKYVAPVAANAGLSIEQTTAMLGVLADAGIRGSQAGTSLRKIISDLGQGAAPMLTQKLGEMAQAGLTGADAMSEVGRTAYASLLVLANNTSKIDNFTGAFNKANGEAREMARIMNDDLIGDWTKFTSSLDGAIQKGSGLNIVMREIVQTMTDVVKTFTGQGMLSTDLKESLEVLNREGKGAGVDRFNMLLKQAQSNAKDAGKELIMLTDEATGMIKVFVKPQPYTIVKQIASEAGTATKSVEELEKAARKAFELSEQQRAKRINSVTTSSAPNTISNFKLTPDSETVKAYESFANMQTHLTSMTDEATASIVKQQGVIVETGSMIAATSSLIGQGFGDVISGAQTAAQAFAQYASQVVHHIGRVIMAKMIEKAIDDRATNFNFFAKLALIGVAIGTASALVRKIGSTNGGAGGAPAVSGAGSYQRPADRGVQVYGELRMANNGTLIGTIRQGAYLSSKLGG